MHSVLLGFGLGFVVAAAIGPISLLCIRTVLRGALISGVAIGAGAASVDMAYALLGSMGAAQLLDIDALRILLSLLGACVLAYFGLRTLSSAFRVRIGAESTAEIATPGRAFLTALAATASNPSTVASWAAIFAAASSASSVQGTGPTLLLCLGVGCGTMMWFTCLSIAMRTLSGRLGNRTLRVVDVAAGVGMLAFAVVLGVRSEQPVVTSDDGRSP